MIRCFAAISIAIMATLLSVAGAESYTLIDECGPTWDELPVNYYIAEEGTEQISGIDVLEDTFRASFDAWQSPCCSEFEAEYNGLVQRDDALEDNTIESVLAFYDEDWPAIYGGPDTIAVTLFLIGNDCQIDNAPILFNSEHHQFTTDGATDGADLQAITTHEVGHLLGLGHSGFLEATMFGAYVGGTSPRTLHEDDIDGVCALYPTDCPCIDDDQCRPGEVCDDGICADDPCRDDDQCQDHAICVDGDCIFPPCTNDDDCSGELVCQNERCVDPCPACRPCSDHADCGQFGYCRIFPHGGRCMISCGQEGQCPGDSICTAVAHGTEEFFFCTAPEPEDADEHCPEEYICQDFDPDYEPCPALGKSCARDTFDCSPVNDICVDRDEEPLCSCTCQTNADCGRDNHCVTFADGQSACLPPAPMGCSEDSDCEDDELCINDECIVAEDEVPESDTGGCGGCTATTPSKPLDALLFAICIAAIYMIRRPLLAGSSLRSD